MARHWSVIRSLQNNSGSSIKSLINNSDKKDQRNDIPPTVMSAEFAPFTGHF